MATPLNEQNILERVAAETRAETETPSSSNAKPVRAGKTASGVRNESTGYFGSGAGTA